MSCSPYIALQIVLRIAPFGSCEQIIACPVRQDTFCLVDMSPLLIPGAPRWPVPGGRFVFSSIRATWGRGFHSRRYGT